MAAIDKIYGTDEEYHEFKTWVYHTRPHLLKYFYPPKMAKSHDRPITNLPNWADITLYRDPDCPQWVKERIEEQYAGPPTFTPWRRRRWGTP